MKTKTKKTYKEITSEWMQLPIEYTLREFYCPNKKCGNLLNEDAIKEYPEECAKVNRLVTCIHCDTKFRLKVKAI